VTKEEFGLGGNGKIAKALAAKTPKKRVVGQAATRHTLIARD